MKYTTQSAIYIPQKPGLRGIWEKIEAGARVCYKSGSKTEYDENGDSISAEKFAKNIINVKKHTSVAEHAAVYLVFDLDNGCWRIFEHPKIQPYVRIVWDNKKVYISTNYRVLVENHLEHLISHAVDEPIKDLHEPIYTFHVITNRGVSAELNRHRHNSPSERSTRYVDASTNFNICISGQPRPIDSGYDRLNIYLSDKANLSADQTYDLAFLMSEYCYKRLRELGEPKQKARGVLPLQLETELMISAFETDWRHFFDLRYFQSTGPVHPDMLDLTTKMVAALPENSNLKQYISKGI